MSRIRTIKPDAFTSETLAEVSFLTRWMFAGLWTYADDDGRAKWNPKLVKAAIFPLDDDVTASTVEQAFIDLEAIGCVCRYEVDGAAYFHCINFNRHQRINRKTDSTHPPCPEHENGSSGRRVTAHTSLTEGSVSTHGDSASGKEGKGREEERKGSMSELVPSADADRLLDLLDELVTANGHRKPNRTRKNVEAARLLLEHDGHTADEIEGAIRWATSHEFWRAHIQSMSKLRDKYQTMALQASGGGSGTRSRAQQQQDSLMRQLEIAQQLDAQEGLA